MQTNYLKRVDYLIKISLQQHSISQQKYVNRINSYFKADGSLWYGKITLASNYFNNRDAVTFYDDKDETISLCGWADDTNAAPIKKAFSEWVKYLEVNR